MSHRITPDSPPKPAAIDLSEVTFAWPGRTDFRLSVDAFALPQGSHAFLQGPSGSGKSTLLGLLAGLMAPQQGQIQLAGTAIESLSRRRRDRFRAEHLGIIFQQFNLVPYLSPLDNVLLPCRFSRKRRHRAGPNPRATAKDLLSGLGLDPDRLGRDVRALSIGQQQRVAAARALIGQPEIILADEPTSALDAEHRDRFIELLLSRAGEYHGSVVLVSHDPALQHRFERVHDIRDWTHAQEVSP